MLTLFRYSIVLLFAASLAAAPAQNSTIKRRVKKRAAESAQMQPTPDRLADIRAALRAHGYDPGTTWEQTQEVCRKIADEHMWQTDHAPDVRVLILLGLGGPHSDPAVTQMQGDRLDQDQRAEAARLAQNAGRYALNSGSATHPAAAEKPAAISAPSKPAVTHAATAKKPVAGKSQKAAATPLNKAQKRKASAKRVRKTKAKPALVAIPRRSPGKNSAS